MILWTTFVGFIEGAITDLGTSLGTLGLGIVTLTFAARAVLIPLTAPLARKSREHRRVVTAIRPQLKEAQQAHKGDFERINAEVKRIHSEHGIGIVDTSGVILALVQLPLLFAFFQAVLHVSEGTAYAESGWLAGLGAAALSVASVHWSGQSESTRWLLGVAAVLPIVMSAWLGAGIGCYLLGFYAASVIEALVLRRSAATPEASGG